MAELILFTLSTETKHTFSLSKPRQLKKEVTLETMS